MALWDKKKKDAFPDGEAEEFADDADEELTEAEELEEDAEYEEEAENEDAASSGRRGGRKQTEKKSSRKTPLIVAAVCFILLIILFTVIAVRSHNRKKADAPGAGAPQIASEQTPQNARPDSPEGAQEAAAQPDAQGPADQQAAPGPAGTAAPEAKTPQASAPAAAPTPAPTPAPSPSPTPVQQSWEIDKDLVVYECILDWDNPTKYHISFAEFDAAGNMGKTYAFKDIVSPSQMGAEFKDDESLPYWFFPGATVHVKANADLSSCTVTKAS